MPNKLAHFAIEADDVDRARKFYETVFQWQFTPWGPPGFYLIEGAGLHGALQLRREPMPEGRRVPTPIGRDDLAQVLQELKEYAQILEPKDVDEPILAPSVAYAVYEWLVEINNAADLAAVKVEPRRLALLYGPPGTGTT
ncbi:MAG: hypothetical protein ABL897_11610, partial [Hyphomicrobium sp.]